MIRIYIFFILYNKLIILVPFDKKKHGEGLFRDDEKSNPEIRN
jgi:hypothetical protein